MEHILPLSIENFEKIAKKNIPLKISNYETFFSKEIQDAANFATGSYFWFIGDNYEMKIKAASQNIDELTPFSHKKWSNASALFFAENLHQDDCLYVLSALSLAVEKIEKLPFESQSNIRVNIYARMLNSDKKFRWVLIQIPRIYIDNETKTNCAIILVTDLSHLDFNQKPILMTLTDKINNQNIYYKIDIESKTLINLGFSSLSKREHEVMLLMTKGLNSPEIAAKLFLSYHTVENHKRNLRRKTNTKTSAELIHFVWSNNLI